MMKYKRFIYLLTGALIMLSNVIWSQDFTAGDMITLHVNDYSLIESNHAPVSLTLVGSVAGAPVSSVSNSDMYLRLSSLVPGGTNREVSVRISNGSIPTGTTLTLIPASCTISNSGGRLGQPILTPIELTTIDQDIITGIGSCYTGTAYNDGFQLTYTWSPTSLASNYSLIEATSSQVNITVVFTITAHDGN